MEIVKNPEGKKLTVAVSGRLDTTTAPQLEAEFNSSLDNYDELVFDMKELEYVSSAGLRVILSAQKKMGTKGGMIIQNVNDEIMEVFDITGFSDILNIQ